MEKEEEFKDDFKDRKRRFLRGLNALLGLDYDSLENKDAPIKNIISTPVHEFRERLANTYCLEFTAQELTILIEKGITSRDFTEKYVEEVYRQRGNVDLNHLIGSSIVNGAIDLSRIDHAPKYGLNGNRWCDVTEGPCSCGAWH